jgi:hypothetical protein
MKIVVDATSQFAAEAIVSMRNDGACIGHSDDHQFGTSERLSGVE